MRVLLEPRVKTLNRSLNRSAICLAAFVLVANGCAQESGASGDAGMDETSDESAGETGTEAGTETGTDTDGEPADFFGDSVLNIAHRGGAGEFPEHTLTAYAGGLAVGVNVLELDVHATSDAELVVMHDDTVDRTTDGTGAIDQMTLAQIKALDAAYTFTTDGSTFPYRGMGIEVPTPDEVFSAHPQELYVIEIKPNDTALVAPLLDALDAHDLRARVVLASTNPDVLDEIRSQASDVHTSLTTSEVVAFIGLDSTTEAAYEPPGLFLQVPLTLAGLSVLDQETVERAERLGMKVHPWTINNEDEMRMLLDWGVHGIMTDYPSRLESVLNE